MFIIDNIYAIDSASSGDSGYKTIEVYSTTNGGTVMPYTLTNGATRGAFATVGMIMKIVVYLLLDCINIMNLFS